MNEQETKRKIAGLKRSLRARAKRKNIPAPYECVGGPFHGEVIFLETSSTGSLRVGKMSGRYEAAGGLNYRSIRAKQPFEHIQWQVAS
jgi:hypothetical protein